MQCSHPRAAEKFESMNVLRYAGYDLTSVYADPVNSIARTARNRMEDAQPIKLLETFRGNDSQWMIRPILL